MSRHPTKSLSEALLQITGFFQSGVACLLPEAGGVGLNLTAATHVIHFDSPLAEHRHIVYLSNIADKK